MFISYTCIRSELYAKDNTTPKHYWKLIDDDFEQQVVSTGYTYFDTLKSIATVYEDRGLKVASNLFRCMQYIVASKQRPQQVGRKRVETLTLADFVQMIKDSDELSKYVADVEKYLLLI